MKTTRLTSTLAFASLCCIIQAAMAADDLFRAVMIKNGDVCVAEGTAPAQCFGRGDGRQRSLPVWSTNGNRIAVIAAPKGAQELARLELLDRQGRQLTDIAVKPLDRGEVPSGMRAVESLEWIGDNQILMGGSINPSSAEYLLIDTRSRRVLNGWIDDGGGLAVSPDRQHVSQIIGAPHFTPASARAPTLVIDDEAVLALAPFGSTPEGPPVWAPDSSSVALRMRGQDQRVSLLIWNRDQRRHRYTALPAPIANGMPVSVRWRGRDLVISSEATPAAQGQPPGPSETLVLPDATEPGKAGAFTRSEGVMTDKARELRRRLVMQAESQGGQQADVWCARCELTSLPRAVGSMTDTD